MTYIKQLLIRMAVWQWLYRNGEPLGDHVRICALCQDLIEQALLTTGLSNSPCSQCLTAGARHTQQDHPYEPDEQHDEARLAELRSDIGPVARCETRRVARRTCDDNGSVTS